MLITIVWSYFYLYVPFAVSTPEFRVSGKVKGKLLMQLCCLGQRLRSEHLLRLMNYMKGRCLSAIGQATK